MLPLPSTLRLLAAGLILATASCSQYSAVTERRPVYHPITPAGKAIATALNSGKKNPRAEIGGYLDAAAAAARDLQAHPNDGQARQDYNFAIGRIFEAVHAADPGRDAWTKPMICPGTGREWTLSIKADPRPERDPALFKFVPADRYQFRGTYVNQRTVKDGLGAPLVVTGRGEDFRKIDRFAQGKNIYYGMTAILRFEGPNAVLSFEDPLATETVRFAGHTYPLAADFTAPLALLLAKENPKKMELSRLLRPEKFAETARLARLQPYDPKKIPIICVHGLMDSPATWMPIINSLRGDPVIRKNYQFWFYSYPSGYPYPHSAAIMRKQMDAINAQYPGHKKVVLIGHSMGGMISRTMVTDSGMTLWNATFSTPPEKLQGSAESNKLVTDALIFRHRPEVARVIFIAAPQRGADMAQNWIGRLGARLVRSPTTLLKVGRDVLHAATLNPAALRLNRMPNSVDTLAPNHRFVKAINTIPITPGIPYHSIIGDRGKGGNRDRTKPVSSDGFVPYWSSHLDGAASELVVPSGHSAHQNPQAIAEVNRILKVHLH